MWYKGLNILPLIPDTISANGVTGLWFVARSSMDHRIFKADQLTEIEIKWSSSSCSLWSTSEGTAAFILLWCIDCLSRIFTWWKWLPVVSIFVPWFLPEECVGSDSPCEMYQNEKVRERRLFPMTSRVWPSRNYRQYEALVTAIYSSATGTSLLYLMLAIFCKF